MCTEGKISRRNDPAVAACRTEVKLSYHAMASPHTCRCLLTNDLLPSQTVIAVHLFKWGWHGRILVLGLTDVNDVRNDLPLWKPLEWAFDTSRLCIIYNEERDQFIAHILEPHIMSVPLAAKGSEPMGHSWQPPVPRLRKLTFKDMHMQPLVFAPDSPLRPFKCVLNFQA